MKVKAIPDGYHTVTPSMSVKDAGKLIDYMKRAFGATESMRMPGPGGVIWHAEVKIGDSDVMLSEAMNEPPVQGSLFLYVKDVDAVYAKALEAGGTSLMKPENMFWGDRFARVKDPFGNLWGMATHVEEVSPEELPKRAAAAMRAQGANA